MSRSRTETHTPPPCPPGPTPTITTTTTDTHDVPTEEKKTSLLYSTEESPPLGQCILFAFQHYLVFIGGTIATPLLVVSFMCMEPNDPYRGDIVSTIIFVSGIITILQVTFGIRLPIIQGANFAYVAPAITIITYSFPACDSLDLSTMTADEKREQWQIRMRELQGAIVVSSVFQVLLGLSGAVGVLMRFVTPLTVVPTVTTLGLSLFSVATAQASSHWGISGLTVVLLVFISQYLKNVQVPYPFYSRGRGFHVNRAPIFTYFPWGVCGILTKLNLLPEESKARTDVTSDLLRDSSWFRIPYPGQWGVPSLSVGGVMGMTAAVFASVVESIGDYQACARVSERLTPPAHAVNRAVACEGLGCVLAGLYGTASGTASYTGNIILIGITRVPSRRVIQVSGLVMLLTGMCGKLCAVFASIPLPVLGGCLMFMFSLVTGIGLAPLQLICLRSPRNLFVLGFSLFIALAVPDWLEKNPGAVQTGYQMIDQGLTSLLQTSLFVGGLSGMILDNTIPGTIEERGLTNWQYFQQSRKSSTSEPADICYDLPFGMTHIERWNWTKYVPFLPTFGGFRRKE